MSESWTVLRLLSWTTDFLKSRGAESPRLDAEVLLASAMGCERIMLYAQFDTVVSDDVRASFRELVKRRAEGTPVAYLVGKKEFYSLSLHVTADVLIPRPETEFVVVAALDALKSISNPGGSGFGVHDSGNGGAVVADVGTGSGAIAIAIAKHAPTARVFAMDASPAALKVAQQNAAALGVADRIDFQLGDLLSDAPPQPRFAVVASNLPYVSESEYEKLSPEVKNHEPRQALVAGPTGAEIIERLIPQAAERLLRGGWLILELSPMIASRVVERIAADGRYEPASVIKDLAGLSRVVQARRKP